MIKKREQLIVTFYTTTDAMAMERLCKEHGVAGRIIPLPGEISAHCGLAWCAPLEREEEVRRFLASHSLRVQEICRCLV